MLVEEEEGICLSHLYGPFGLLSIGNSVVKNVWVEIQASPANQVHKTWSETRIKGSAVCVCAVLSPSHCCHGHWSGQERDLGYWGAKDSYDSTGIHFYQPVCSMGDWAHGPMLTFCSAQLSLQYQGLRNNLNIKLQPFPRREDTWQQMECGRTELIWWLLFILLFQSAWKRPTSSSQWKSAKVPRRTARPSLSFSLRVSRKHKVTLEFQKWEDWPTNFGLAH